MSKNPLKTLRGDEFEEIASRFRALSEASRLKIIAALQSGEKNVTELVEQTSLSQPNVSRHLSVLVVSGLIGRRKDGSNVLYRVIDKSLSEICSVVCKSICSK